MTLATKGKWGIHLTACLQGASISHFFFSKVSHSSLLKEFNFFCVSYHPPDLAHTYLLPIIIIFIFTLNMGHQGSLWQIMEKKMEVQKCGKNIVVSNVY